VKLFNRPATTEPRCGSSRTSRDRTVSPIDLGVFITLLVVLIAPVATHAQVVIAREVVEEAAEQIFRQAGREGLEELTEMGGRVVIRDLLERSASEGGEALVKKVVQYGIEDGPIALRAISGAPKAMVEALDGLAPELRSSALRAIDRDPKVMIDLVKRFGTGAAEVAARQPGTGEILIQKLGVDGIRLGRHLSTDDAVIVTRHADEIAGLRPTDRVAVLESILRSPERALTYLETHPKVLATAAGVSLFLATKDELLGDKGSSVVLNNGKMVTIPSHPGLLERLTSIGAGVTREPVALIGYVVAAGIGGWFAIHLLGKWQRQRTSLRFTKVPPHDPVERAEP
jgi:hypothetical protein